MDSLNEQAINNFREYLRFETLQPAPDYSQSIEFIKKQAEQLDLECQVMRIYPEAPIVILKWVGENSDLKSLVLNSHMDVVPVFSENWKYPPFSAHLDDEGNIYARGSQDMKNCAIQYLEAIRRIKIQTPEFVPERTVYVLFVPDEEVGGKKGMEAFADTEIFNNMNIGLMMDEGIACPDDKYYAFYSERVMWWIRIYVNGSTGHGSHFIQNSAGVKARYILDKFMDYREKEEKRMIENDLSLGEVSTVNLTGVTGGVMHNVVPSPFIFDFDIRVTPSEDLSAFKATIDRWTKECGEGIEYEFIHYTPSGYVTVNDTTNEWWLAFESVCKSLNMEILPQIFPAGTDSRFVRKKGISSIGFCPINNTPILLHDHNEYINKETFLRGIDFYVKLILEFTTKKES